MLTSDGHTDNMIPLFCHPSKKTVPNTSACNARYIVATWAVQKGMFVIPWGRPAWAWIYGRQDLSLMTLASCADMVVNVYLEGGLLRFCGGAWMFFGDKTSGSWLWLAVRIWLFKILVALSWKALGREDSIMENSGGFRLNIAINTDCAFCK